MILTGAEQNTWQKTCPSVTLFTTNPIQLAEPDSLQWEAGN